MCIFAPLVTKYGPFEGDINTRFLDPSWEHPFGTDNFGRDIFSRILFGGRITLPSSFFTLFLTTLLGMILGIISGFNNGNVFDLIIMRTADILIACPFIVIAMAVSGFFGPGLGKILILIVFTFWAKTARLSKSLTLESLNSAHVISSKVSGASNLRIIRRDIFPDIISQIIVHFTFELSNVILSIATLSFFGLGGQPPAPEWGSMLSDGRVYMSTQPNLLIFTILVIFLVVFSFNIIGEYFREKQEPLYITARWEVLGIWKNS